MTPKSKPKPANAELPAFLTSANIVHAGAVVGTITLALGFIAMCVMCLVAPANAASMYGIKADKNGWLVACGLRDLAFGVATLALYTLCKPALVVFVASCLVVPVGDMAVVSAFSGGDISAMAPHAVGVVCIATLCIFLKKDPAFA